MNEKRNALPILTAVVLCGIISAPSAQAFYNPGTGRWLNRDPISESGGPNLAAFVANEPMRFHDPKGLAAEPQAPDCSPCQWLGWEHRMAPDAPSGDPWGWADVNEIVPPDIDYSSGRACCVCGKPGRRFNAISPVCTAKIWIAASHNPEDPVHNAGLVTGASASIWHHETRHVQHFTENVRSRDNLYKTFAPICVPDNCQSQRTRVLVLFSSYYNSLRTAKDADINCRDASADCSIAATFYRDAETKMAEASAAFNAFISCMISVCGYRDFGANICGFGTCP